jgi:hypothetical protein
VNEYDYLAARAGVVWNEGDRYSHGHVATVLTVLSGVFSHPCTCPIGVDHAALVPSENPDSGEPDDYVVDAVVPPIPDVVPVEARVEPVTDPDSVFDSNNDEDGNKQ